MHHVRPITQILRRDALLRKLLATPLDILLGAGALSGLLFLYLCAEVRERATLTTDLSVRYIINAHAASVPERLVSTVSSFGSAPSVAGLGLLLCIVCSVRRRWLDMLFVASAVAGCAALTLTTQGLMHHVLRRADLFPSGHAVGATCLAVASGDFLWRGRRGKVVKGLGTVALAIAVACVGGSRLLLHRHYPTDVAGGVLLGVAWMASLLAMRLVAVRWWALSDGELSGIEASVRPGGRRGRRAQDAGK